MEKLTCIESLHIWASRGRAGRTSRWQCRWCQSAATRLLSHPNQGVAISFSRLNIPTFVPLPHNAHFLNLPDFPPITFMFSRISVDVLGAFSDKSCSEHGTINIKSDLKTI